MALIQANIMSKSLMRTVPINVILPTDKMVFPGMPVREEKPYKTLYLLHGVFGSYIDWVSGTNIQRWAEERDLVVVMPSGDNRFYTDGDLPDAKYSQFIGEELVELTRKSFPLSRKREDTYIAGLSMGGYGALYNALRHNETFSCVAALSGANIVEGVGERKANGKTIFDSRAYAEACFGDLDKVMETDRNLEWRARQLIEEKLTLPKVYMACGTEDGGLESNRALSEYLKGLGFDVTFEQGPGAHEWDFWNRYILHVLDWLPLENNGAGINSGNVTKA